MLDTVLLFGLLLLGSSMLFFIIYIGKYISKRGQRRDFATLPESLLSEEQARLNKQAKVSILAFSTATCRQCRLLQTPVLQRVKEAHENEVAIIHIMATSSPELVERFRVDTFPTTALFDASGRLYAINYGFANAQCLLKQVGELLQSQKESEAQRAH
jgi:thioredoxin-related protein